MALRIIGHLDMDAFFASIEERDNPRFAGRPIVVGADPKDGSGRGVVSTANYAARKYGIKSALPISKAWQFSEAARRRGLPSAVFIEGNHKKYGEASRRVMAILRTELERVFTSDPAIIQEASVDEAYFDLSAAGSYEAAAAIARAIKREIKIKENLTASIGIGPNKLMAKIASDAEKPDGLTVIHEEDAEKFLEPLSIRTIPGIGPKTEEEFKKLGVRTIGDGRRFSVDGLKQMMGKWGPSLYERLRGRDDAELVEDWTVKSIGEQETFECDATDAEFLRERLGEISRNVYNRFTKADFKRFRTIAITVRFADFTTKTRATTLTSSDARLETIEFHALRLFLPFLDARENPRKKALRLLGVRIEKLE